jgi:hypothetical protein
MISKLFQRHYIPRAEYQGVESRDNDAGIVILCHQLNGVQSLKLRSKGVPFFSKIC